jgi:hypothetical protein
MILLVCDVLGCDGDAVAGERMYAAPPTGWTRISYIEKFTPDPVFSVVRGSMSMGGGQIGTQENVVSSVPGVEFREVVKLMCPKHRPPSWKPEGEPLAGVGGEGEATS